MNTPIKKPAKGGIPVPKYTIGTAEDDPLWYKDAIIYQLHVKSFFDLNNDGIGDSRG
jgi:maltose alpha-D-glucosyltransferase/alpha-amylase